MKVNDKNLVEYIIEYEGGDLDDEDTLDLFSYLIKTGMAYKLQGHYGRTAEALIYSGLMDKKGNILSEDLE